MPGERTKALYKLRAEEARLNESLGRALYTTRDLRNPDELFRVQMKKDFVRLYIKNDYHLRETAEDMGLSTHTLNKWLQLTSVQDLIKETRENNKKIEK